MREALVERSGPEGHLVVVYRKGRPQTDVDERVEAQVLVQVAHDPVEHVEVVGVARRARLIVEDSHMVDWAQRCIRSLAGLERPKQKRRRHSKAMLLE